MKYVSIDLETTGLDPETCDIIEIGAVIDDLSDPSIKAWLPQFHAYVVKENYQGEPYALSMHPEIFKRIATRAEGYQYLAPEEVGKAFFEFLKENGLEGTITAAGKNFASFDAKFLKKLPEFEEWVKIRHRVIDPAMLYWKPEEDGTTLPGTSKCMERAGLSGVVAHTALEDALVVVDLIRRKILPTPPLEKTIEEANHDVYKRGPMI